MNPYHKGVCSVIAHKPGKLLNFLKSLIEQLHVTEDSTTKVVSKCCYILSILFLLLLVPILGIVLMPIASFRNYLEYKARPKRDFIQIRYRSRINNSVCQIMTAMAIVVSVTIFMPCTIVFMMMAIIGGIVQLKKTKRIKII
jgi:hypothetical protein